MPISKLFKRIEDTVQIADDTKFPWQPEKILQQIYGQIKKCGIYKYERKEWTEKDELPKTWENFKTHFTESYFEPKEENELNNKHAGFMVHDNIYQPHMEESQTADTLNNLANAVTSYATKLTNLTTTNTNLAEQLKLALSQNKVLPELPRKIYMRCHINSVRKPEHK